MAKIKKKKAKKRPHILVKGKCTPKGGRPDRNLIHVSRSRCLVKTHLNGQPDTLAGIVPALRVSSTARLADGHDAQSLDDGQRMLVRLIIQQPQRLLEEVVARRVRIVGKLPRHGLRGKPTAQGQQGIDQNGRAVSMPPVSKVPEEMLLAEGRESGVLPAKVQGQQMMDQIHVACYIGPRPGRAALHLGARER